MSKKNREHVNENGEFKSNLCDECPEGWMPLRFSSRGARPLLLLCAEMRESKDPAFSSDVRFCVEKAGGMDFRDEKLRTALRNMLKKMDDAAAAHGEAQSSEKTTTSGLADAIEYFDSCVRYHINAGEKYGLIIFAELRRLEDVERTSAREGRALDAILSVAEKQQARIAELELIAGDLSMGNHAAREHIDAIEKALATLQNGLVGLLAVQHGSDYGEELRELYKVAKNATVRRGKKIKLESLLEKEKHDEHDGD